MTFSQLLKDIYVAYIYINNLSVSDPRIISSSGGC